MTLYLEIEEMIVMFSYQTFESSFFERNLEFFIRNSCF